MSLDDLLQSTQTPGAAADQAGGVATATRRAKSLDDLLADQADPSNFSKNSPLYRPTRLGGALETAANLTGIPAALRLGKFVGNQGAQLGQVASGQRGLGDYAEENLNLDKLAQPVIDAAQLGTMGVGVAKFGPLAVAKATALGAVGGGAGQAALGPEAARLGNKVADAGYPIAGALVASAPASLGALAGNVVPGAVRSGLGGPVEGPLLSRIAPQDRISAAQAARNAQFEAQAGQITPAQARMPLNNEMPQNDYSDFERRNFNSHGREIQGQQMAQLGPEGRLGDISQEMGADGSSPITRDISEYGQQLRQLPGQAKGQVDEAFGKARNFLSQLPQTEADQDLGPSLMGKLRTYMRGELNIPFRGNRPVPYNANMKLDEPTYNALVNAYRESLRVQSPEDLLTQRQNFGSAADRAFQAYEKGTPDREARAQTGAYRLYNEVLDKHLGDNFPQFLPAWKQANALASHVRSAPFKATAQTLEGSKDPSVVVRDLINGQEDSLKNYMDAFGNYNPSAEGASKGLIVPGAEGAPGPSAQGGAKAVQQLKEASLAELWRRSQDPEGNLNYSKLRNAWTQTFTPAMKQLLFSPEETASLDNLVANSKAATAPQVYSYKANPSGTALMMDQLGKTGGNPLSALVNMAKSIKPAIYYGPGRRLYMPSVVQPSPGTELGFMGGQAAAAAAPNIQAGADEDAKQYGWPYGPKLKGRQNVGTR